MKIPVGSDMRNGATDFLVDHLRQQGFELELMGALNPDSPDNDWSVVGNMVGRNVIETQADFGAVCCWTGTGASIAANKVKGIRAALCTDAQTAAGAKKWNDANVLALSLRLLSEPLIEEIISAWLKNKMSAEEEDRRCLDKLNKIESNI